MAQQGQTPQTDEIVRVDGLYKKYAKKADWAVENVSFSVRAGEIVGLLGLKRARSPYAERISSKTPSARNRTWVLSQTITPCSSK